MENKKYNFKGWITWISLLAAVIMVSIQRQQMAVFAEHMANQFSISETQVSNLATSTMYGLMIMQIPAGIFVDKFGVRKTNIISLSITMIASGIIFFTHSYYVALICRFVIGLGLSTISISVFKVQAEWFKVSHFTLLSAVMMFVANLGAYITTTPLSILIEKFGGEKTLFFINAYTIFCFSLVILFVKDNKKLDTDYHKFNVVKSIKEVMLNPYTWPPMAVIFFMLSTTSSLLGFWAVPFLRETYSIDTVQAAGYFSYFTIGFMLGAIVSSLVDKVKFLNYKFSLSIFAFIYALSWIYIMIICKGKPPIIIIPILFIIMGTAVTNHLFAFTAVKTVNKIENIGIATSVVTSMDFAGSVILNTLITSKIAGGSTINQSFVLMLSFAIMSFIASLFVKYKKIDNI